MSADKDVENIAAFDGKRKEWNSLQYLLWKLEMGETKKIQIDECGCRVLVRKCDEDDTISHCFTSQGHFMASATECERVCVCVRLAMGTCRYHFLAIPRQFN